MSQIESKPLLLSNLNKILLQHLEKTIEHIHYKYKKYFTEEDMKNVMQIISSNIDFQDMEQEQLELMNKKITNKIVTRQIYNCGIYKNSHSIPDDNERCHARIWANGYVKSDEEYQYNNNNNNNNDNNSTNIQSNITFGKRCSRRINPNCPNSKYCGHHIKNNPHGDYTSSLNKCQTLNFLKNSKLLNNNKLPNK